VGKVEGIFNTIDDIENLILSRSMFYRVRADKYELIPETTVAEYFTREDAKEEDIDSYLSFQNVEITRRGTLEVRSDCAQPVKDAFCAPAFNLGMLLALDETRTLIDDFMQKKLPTDILNSDKRNKILRDSVIYHYELPVDKNATRTLLCDLIALSEKALKIRNKGEEKLLSCLYERAENLTCPAKEWKKALENGTDYTDLIKKYATAE
jgi:gamma-glutamylcysteine synthetase